MVTVPAGVFDLSFVRVAVHVVVAGTVTAPGEQLNVIDVATAAEAGGQPGSPTGHLDQSSLDGATLRVAGWSYDSDAGSAPLDVSVTVDGSIVGHANTGGARPDVAETVGSGAATSGFDAALPVSIG